MSASYPGILEYLESLPVIDSHEHLPDESERLKQNVDFTTLFSHYCTDDLAAAGMTPTLRQAIFGQGSVEEKWRAIAPLLPLTRTSGYMRAAYIAMQRFYGLDHLESLQDAEELTRRIRAANTEGLYARVLRDACGIRVSMNFTEKADPEYFRLVKYCSPYTQICHMEDVAANERLWNRAMPTLRSYVEGMLDALQAEAEAGNKGIKIGHAYTRPLDFDVCTEHEAEMIYNRVLSESLPWSKYALGYAEARPLENFLIRRVVEFAGDAGLPVVIHVGFQTGQQMKLDDARPHRLWELIRRYRGTRFSMLHGGLPWVDEGAVMARQLENLSIDMGWMHIMCPEMAVQALMYYFDMVPSSKVLGFGGDYLVVEKVYGHLTIARCNIARALSARVEDGSMAAKEARGWCRALMHDSANGFYSLGYEPLEGV